ncbi:MAG: HAD-IA family hydrolase [Pseudomonadota bacterium]
MPHTALFLGSIGVLSETSDLQRQAFNRAFAEGGLDWVLTPEHYADLLLQQGGRARIARVAEAKGARDDVDIDALYAAKQAQFQALLNDHGTPARPGVRELLAAAGQRGMLRAFVTSTSGIQVQTVLMGLRGAVRSSDFDYIGERRFIENPKPAPDIYQHAMETLGVDPGDVLCIEDTPESAEAAQAAGLTVIGFPGAPARTRRFPDGVATVEFLSPSLLDLEPVRIAAE